MFLEAARWPTRSRCTRLVSLGSLYPVLQQGLPQFQDPVDCVLQGDAVGRLQPLYQTAFMAHLVDGDTRHVMHPTEAGTDRDQDDSSIL